MILGIKFERIPNDSMGRVKITQIDRIGASDSIDTSWLRKFILDHNISIIVPRRDDIPFIEGETIKEADFYRGRLEEFYSIEKGTIHRFESFLYRAGVMAGKSLMANEVERIFNSSVSI